MSDAEGRRFRQHRSHLLDGSTATKVNMVLQGGHVMCEIKSQENKMKMANT